MEVSFLIASVPDSRVVDANTYVNVYSLDTLERTNLEGRKGKMMMFYTPTLDSTLLCAVLTLLSRSSIVDQHNITFRSQHICYSERYLWKFVGRDCLVDGSVNRSCL